MDDGNQVSPVPQWLFVFPRMTLEIQAEVARIVQMVVVSTCFLVHAKFICYLLHKLLIELLRA